MLTYLIVLFAVIFPLGQIGRLNLFNSGIVFHPLDVFLAGGLILLVTTKRQYLQKFWTENSLRRPIMLFIAIIIVSLGINFPRLGFEKTFLGALYPLRWLLCFGIYLCVASLTTSEKGKLKKWLILPILIVAITGLAQYIILPNVSFLKSDGWDDHYFRVIGTFLDPGFTGMFLVLGLIWFFLEIKKNWLYWLGIGLTYVVLALTYSRASFLAFVAAFGTISVLRKDWKIGAAAMILLLVTIWLLPTTFGEGTKLGRENSSTARITNWKHSFEIWKSAPLAGVGYNSYRYSLAERNLAKLELLQTSHGSSGADSSLLLILATTGLTGLVAYLFLIKESMQLGKKSILFVTSLLAVGLHSWFNNTLLYPWIMVWLWMLLALV